MRTQYVQNYYEPMLQLRYNSIIFYSLATNNVKRNYHVLNYTHSDGQTFQTYETYSGQTTKGSVKRIRKAVDLLLQLSPERWITNTVTSRRELHKLSFITLTIPGNERRIEASEGHKLLLAPWLLRMKRKANLSTYIWKAEFQKNGQLHYHITTPSWIPYYLIRDEWNNIMSKNQMLAEWFKDHPNKMPNSTDVHKVYKVKDLGAYLQKYLSKNDQDKKTKGKIWDCSMNLKQTKFYAFPEPSNVHDYIPFDKIKNCERCGFFNTKSPIDHIPPDEKIRYKQFLKEMKAY